MIYHVNFVNKLKSILQNFIVWNKIYKELFPDRLVAGLKILALPTVVRIHLREFFLILLNTLIAKKFFLCFLYNMNMNLNINSPSFKSVYTVDTGSATSKTQIFTLGALMNNFWLNNAGTTFNKIRNTGVYGQVDFNVKDYKDSSFESIMNNNGISYKKKNNTLNYIA